MTNNERRYKIQEIEKYSDDLDREKTNNLLHTCLLGGGAVTIVAGIISGHEIMEVISHVSIIAGTSMFIPGIMGFVNSISKQTILKDKILGVQEELINNSFIIKNNETEERKGMKR